MKKTIIIALCLIVVVLGVILIVKGKDTSTDTQLTVKEIYTKIAEKVTLPEEMVERDANDLDMRYGIDTTKAKDYIFMANATSYYVDTIAIFKVENAEDRKNIQSSLTTIKMQAENSMNNYDAEQYKVAKDGVIYTKGNYVVLVMTNDSAKVKNIIDEHI